MVLLGGGETLCWEYMSTTNWWNISVKSTRVPSLSKMIVVAIDSIYQIPRALNKRCVDTSIIEKRPDVDRLRITGDFHTGRSLDTTVQGFGRIAEMKRFTIAEALSGGNPRTLGRAEEMVALVLNRPARIAELFECLFDDDEIVRMRAGDAVEKVCRAKPELLKPYVKRLLHDVSRIDQPSVQWHLAQMLAEVELTPKQKAGAIRLLKRNLSQSTDWIVINCTMDSLAKFAQNNPRLRREFVETLREYQNSSYKSIASRARRLLARLGRD